MIDLCNWCKIRDPYIIEIIYQRGDIFSGVKYIIYGQVELSNMYRTMEGTHFKNPELAIEAVLNG